MSRSIFIDKDTLELDRPIRRKHIDEVIVSVNYSTEAWYDEEGNLEVKDFCIHTITTTDLAGATEVEAVVWDVNNVPMGIWRQIATELEESLRDCG